ncbi:MAG: hypothetical protein DI527_02060 [Chelatococcus sp.]|nr:MAG: hypothetical protein DI527_02060 [Chelatococcus sp.]
MVDLWGPGAFGAADAAAVRPAYTPANGAGDPDTFYKDCSSPADDDGTEWVAPALNALIAQLRSLARKSGVPVSNLDDDLLTKASRSFGLNYRAATGTANALAITLDPPVTAWTELVNVPLLIKAASANSSTTVTLSADGLAAKPLKRLGGADLAIGDLQPGCYYWAAYDGTQVQIVSTLGTVPGASTPAAPLLKSIDAVISTNNSVPTTTATILNFQTTTRNNLGTSTWNGQRLTVGAGESGLWYIQAAWSFFTPADDRFAATQIRKNGTTIIGEGDYPYNKNGGGTIVQGHTIVPLAAGDYIEAMAYHQAGSTQPAYADARSRFFAALMSAY